MIDIKSLYDDKGTYLFRRKEYPKVKMQPDYDSVEEAKKALEDVLDNAVQARQQEDIKYIQSGYIVSLARIASRLPEAKRDEALKALPENVAEQIRNLISGNNKLPESEIPEDAVPLCISYDVSEIKYIVHKVSALISSKEIKDMIAEKVSYDESFKEELEKAIFLFEDIIYLNDFAVQKILREIDADELAKALYGCDEELLQKFLRNMSDRAGKMLAEDLHSKHSVPEAEVNYCKYRIMRVIYRLKDIGEICIEKFEADNLI